MKKIIFLMIMVRYFDLWGSLTVAHGYNQEATAELFEAAVKNNNVSQIKIALANKADVNAVDVDGRTILHFTVINKNNVKVIGVLLKYGAQVNAVDFDEMTPLMYAAQGNDLERVGFLIAAGAVLNIANKEKNTPLIYAIAKNNEEMVALLIAAGAAVNIVNKKNMTPLMYAVPINQENIMRMLLEAGASIPGLIENEELEPRAAVVIRLRQDKIEKLQRMKDKIEQRLNIPQLNYD